MGLLSVPRDLTKTDAASNFQKGESAEQQTRGKQRSVKLWVHLLRPGYAHRESNGQ